MPDFSLFILSGGKSRRMGSDKGLMLFQGKPMVKHLIDRYKDITPKIIIIANIKDYINFDVPVIKDNYQNCGPIGGIEAGLAYSDTEINLFLSCDNPFVEYDLLEHLINNRRNSELVFPEFEKKHPFPGLYSMSIHERLKILIDEGLRKMSDLKTHFNVCHLNCTSFNKNNFINFNDSKDIECWNNNLKP